MLLQQINSGKSNGLVQSFHTAYYENSRYLVSEFNFIYCKHSFVKLTNCLKACSTFNLVLKTYGSGNKLVIYNGLSEMVQTIHTSEILKESSNQEKITSVEISELDGKVSRKDYFISVYLLA